MVGQIITLEENKFHFVIHLKPKNISLVFKQAFYQKISVYDDSSKC